MSTKSDFQLKSGKPTIIKDPDAVLDYTLDLTAWLEDIGDTILSATTESVGVVVDSTEIANGNKIIAWVSGGIVGELGSVTFRFTTTSGRIDDRTLYFNIRER